LSLVLIMQAELENLSLVEESSLVESPVVEHDKLESLFWGDVPQFCPLGSVCPSVED
jgi:hypothetical protein